MIREIIAIGGVVVVGVVIYAIVRYKREIQNKGIQNVDRIYTDFLTGGEIKTWFSEKLISEQHQGLILYPTAENIKKWNIKLVDVNENVIIQAVYDKENDIVIQYREVSFSSMSEKMRKILDENGGCIVIENKRG